VQVADGLWTHDANGVRPAVQGYDRLLTLGDQSWDNYEVSLSVTMHDLTTVDPRGRDGGGFAFGMLWDGHTDEPISGLQPKAGWEHGAAFFYEADSRFRLYGYEDFFPQMAATGPVPLDEGSTYNFKIRVEQTNILDRLYSLKMWEQGEAEPTEWLLQDTENFSAPATGSLYLNAHYFDVAFGDIEVREIVGDDIIPGQDSSDVVVAVGVGDANPGQGETDVLIGGAGSDTFAFGDSGGTFYDDGDDGTEGLEDFALIWDFMSGVDQIQLAGSMDEYVLGGSPSGLPSGTGVYKVNQTGPDELVGVVNDVIGLSLDSNDFLYETALA